MPGTMTVVSLLHVCAYVQHSNNEWKVTYQYAFFKISCKQF